MLGDPSSRRIAPGNRNNSDRISSVRAAALRKKESLKNGFISNSYRRNGRGDDSNWLGTEVYQQSTAPSSTAKSDDQVLSSIHAKKYQSFLRKYFNGILLVAIVFVHGLVLLLSILLHFLTKAAYKEDFQNVTVGSSGAVVMKDWLAIVASLATLLLFILPGYLVWLLRLWKSRLSNTEERRFPPRIYSIFIPYLLQIEAIFCYGALVSQGLMLFARVYGGSCSTTLDRMNPIFCTAELATNHLPQDSAIAVIFLPGVLYHAVKGALSWRSTMYHWALSFFILLACLIYSGSWSSWTLLLISCFEGIRLLAIHRQNVALFRSVRDYNRELLTSVRKESKRVQAEEVRNIIANTAHDIKSPMQAFTNSMNLLKDCIKEVIEVAKANKEKSVLPRIDEDSKEGEFQMKLTAAGGSPLGSLVDDAVLLEKYLLPCLDIVDDMYVTTEFMSMSLNRALDFSKVSRGIALMPTFQCVNILDSIDWAIRCIQGLSENMTILMKPLPHTVFAYCITDRQWLNENLLCVLSNAVKFSSEGVVEIDVSLHEEDTEVSISKVKGSSQRIVAARTGKTQRVSSTTVTPQGTLASKARQRMLKFTITDCGVGITPEAASAAFKPMDDIRRQSTDRHSGGAGLGLYSLAKRVEALGGRCGISSRTDGQRGTVCWFMEPYRPDYSRPPSEYEPIDDRAAAEAEARAAEEQAKLAKNALEARRSLENNASDSEGGGGGGGLGRASRSNASTTAAAVHRTPSRMSSRDSKEAAFTSQRRSRIASGGIFLPQSVRIRGGDSSVSVSIRGQNSVYGDMLNPFPEVIRRSSTTLGLGQGPPHNTMAKRASRDHLGMSLGILGGIKEGENVSNLSDATSSPQPVIIASPTKAKSISAKRSVKSRENSSNVNPSSKPGSPVFMGPDQKKGSGNFSSPKNMLTALGSAVSNSVRRSSPMKMMARKNSAQSISQLQPLRVLVVDDSLPILKTITRTLEKSRHTVETAQNGAAALDLLKAKKYDVVLMDIQMPVMDGIEAVEKLRQFEAMRELEAGPHSSIGSGNPTDEASRDNSSGTNRKHQIVIGVSANADAVTASKALKAGMNKFMPKPFTLRQFNEIVLQEAPEFGPQNAAAGSSSTFATPSRSAVAPEGRP